MDFTQIVTSRYATKKFTGEKLSEEKIDQLKNLIKLSASSFGLQPYKIKVVSDKEVLEKLAPAAYGQPQITTCSHLFVFCSNPDAMGQIDAYEQMMLDAGTPKEKVDPYIGMMRDMMGSYDDAAKEAWAAKQTYIALGNAINGAKELGFDSCPMEGFDSAKVAEILELPKTITPQAIVTVGIADDTPRPKIRFDNLFI